MGTNRRKTPRTGVDRSPRPAFDSQPPSGDRETYGLSPKLDLDLDHLRRTGAAKKLRGAREAEERESKAHQQRILESLAERLLAEPSDPESQSELAESIALLDAEEEARLVDHINTLATRKRYEIGARAAQQYKVLQVQEAKLDEKQRSLAAYDKWLDDRKVALAEKERGLLARADDLDLRESALRHAESLQDWEDQVAAAKRDTDLAVRDAELERSRSEGLVRRIERAVETLDNTADAIDTWLPSGRLIALFEGDKRGMLSSIAVDIRGAAKQLRSGMI